MDSEEQAVFNPAEGETESPGVVEETPEDVAATREKIAEIVERYGLDDQHLAAAQMRVAFGYNSRFLDQQDVNRQQPICPQTRFETQQFYRLFNGLTGGKVWKVDSEAEAALAEAMKPVADRVAERYDPQGLSMFQVILDELKK